MAKEKLEIDVTADAKQATKELGAVTKEVEKLEKADAEVKVTADDEASKVLDQVEKKAKSLTTGDFDVTVQGKVDSVLADLEKVGAEAKETAVAADALGRALGPELAAQADTTRIVADLQKLGLTADEIAANADQLGAKLKELADIDVGGKLGGSLGTARGKMDEMGQSASSSKSVLANMVGNSAQDLGALAGVAGSAGVAFGQMGEYIADAKASGEGFGSILKSFGGVAAPLVGIAIATQLISEHMQNIAEAKAFNAKRVTDYASKLDDAKVSAEELLDVLNDDKSTGIFARVDGETKDLDKSVRATLGTFQAFQDVLADPGGVDDYADSILEAGKNAHLTRIEMTGLEQAVAAARDGDIGGLTVLRAKNAGMLDEILTLTALAAATKTVTGGTEEAAFQTEFYGDALGEADKAGKDLATATEILAQAQEDAAAATQAHTDAIDAQLEAMLGAADSHIAYTDALDDVISAQNESRDAMVAEAEAQTALDKAIKEHGAASKEATEATEALTDAKEGSVSASKSERDAAISAAQAAVQYGNDTASASGHTLTAAQRLDTLNASLIYSAQNATPAAKQAIIDYIAETNKISAEKATEIVANAHTDVAEAQLKDVSRTRDALIVAEAVTGTAQQVLDAFVKRNSGTTIPLQIRIPGAKQEHGGTTPPGGGIAGEAGPEFIKLPGKRTTLIDRPQYVPPGTRVTSVVKTRQILKGRRYAGGTQVPAPVPTAPGLPPILVNLDGRPVAALIGSTTAPAVRAAAMRIRAGRA
jgi:hypothetical protein